MLLYVVLRQVVAVVASNEFFLNNQDRGTWRGRTPKAVAATFMKPVKNVFLTGFMNVAATAFGVRPLHVPLSWLFRKNSLLATTATTCLSTTYKSISGH